MTGTRWAGLAVLVVGVILLIVAATTRPKVREISGTPYYQTTQPADGANQPGRQGEQRGFGGDTAAGQGEGAALPQSGTTGDTAQRSPQGTTLPAGSTPADRPPANAPGATGQGGGPSAIPGGDAPSASPQGSPPIGGQRDPERQDVLGQATDGGGDMSGRAWLWIIGFSLIAIGILVMIFGSKRRGNYGTRQDTHPAR